MLILKLLTSSMHYNYKSLIAKKNLLIFIFFFILFNFFCSNKTLANESKYDFCESIEPEKFINQSFPDKIVIETLKPKKWSTNIFELFLELNSKDYQTNNVGWYTFQIKEKYKKKFKSKIKFIYKDQDYECHSNGKISIRGDLWWHLDWINGQPFSSLRIDLENGHLNNNVKFNLLLPKSRVSMGGDINLELYVTELFNQLNFLAPKSRIVDIEINGQKNKYLFQEILAKEFLEKRNLVEGPILEGDTRFTTDQFSNNQWRGDLGFARMINSSYSTKSKANKEISFNAVSILNNVFLDNAVDYKKNTRCVHDYLSINGKKFFHNIKERRINQIYEALIFATETDHSLSCDDRKFYFDPIDQIFLPIYNDGKSTLKISNEQISNKIIKSNVTYNSIEGADEALTLINKINDKTFFRELVSNGFSLNFNDYNKIKKKIINNLIELKKVTHKNEFKQIPDYFKNIESNFLGKKIKLVFVDLNSGNLDICNFKLDTCVAKSIKSNKQLVYKELLSQRFDRLNKILSKENYYIFLSISKKYNLLTKSLKSNEMVKQKINNNFNVSFNDSVNIKVDNDGKKIKFELLNPNSRIKIFGDLVDSWNFEISGKEYTTNNKQVRNYKRSSSKLTGCLTFIDILVKNINLKSNYALCEDAYNFIRTNGSISSAIIENSVSDGLDFDFSNLNILTLNIDKSKNDCIDMSFGNYNITKANIEDCGDKAISVGEKSNVKINSSVIKNANYGVASKDSSKVVIKNSSISDVKYCLSSYRKKQEFSGGIIDAADISCKNFYELSNVDGHSKILKKDIKIN